MIRLRSKKLLSGVSTLAVLAAFGTVDPVLADTITGPGNVPAVNTDDLADLGPVDINTNANVGVDGSGRSFYNPSTNTLAGAASNALEIDDSVLQGSIVNDGTITSNIDAIHIENSIINGRIINNGVISSTGAEGIQFAGDSIFNGLTNTGTILGGDSGVEIDGDVVFLGGIVNSGIINGLSGNAIDIDSGASFSGGISNNGTASQLLGGSGAAITTDADSFTGGISNAGTIRGSAGGVEITGGVFTGGISNAATGTIAGTSTGAHGIEVGVDLFQGGITNAGRIDATTSSANAILLNGNTFQGGINNTGSIVAETTAIEIATDIFQGGITNAGVIESTAEAAIYVNTGTFDGGIRNSGTLLGRTTTLYISNTLFNGGVTNSGLIDSTNTSGAVYIGTTEFNGGFNNTATGTILSNNDETFLFDGTTFNGGLTNAGLIRAETESAVLIQGTTFNGGVTNSGTIISGGGSGNGLYTSNSTFTGGINNSGLIQGQAAGEGIQLNDTTFAGGITNSGTISGGTTGLGIVIDTSSFTGGINNQAGGTILSSGGQIAIDVNGGTFAGGLVNAGLIASSGSTAIQIDNDSFAGGINNSSTGTISGNADGIEISTATFEGGITNAGLIESTGGDTGIRITSDSFAGGINNLATGTIQGTDGIDITNTTFTGGITNAGLIATTDTEHGINISNTTFTGGIQNSGTIIGDTAIQISTTTFEGGIVNTGRLEGTSTDGLLISATNFSGGINNSGVITAATDAVDVSVTNWNGDFTNSGTIETSESSGTGVELDATNFSGNFVNSGIIRGGTTSGDGVNLTGTLFDGDVTNSGTIVSPSSVGLSLNHSLYTGNVTNSGTITAADTGIYVSNVVAGTLTNSGLIDPSYGILVDGEIQGGIFNSGTILATVTAIDLSSTSADHVITQTGGLIQGNSLADGTGTIETALDLDQVIALQDTFNGNGGVLDGDVIGGAGDGDNFAVGGNFVYLRGTASDIDQLDFNSGRGAFGVRDANGDGLDDATGGQATSNLLAFTAEDMNVNAGGTALLGELTTVTLNNDLNMDPDGTLAYFLTTGTAGGTPGSVNAANDANLDGTLLAVLDPIDFASSTTNTYTYQDIVTGTINGTFTNVSTSSLFWTADADYNAGDVDLTINRIDFGDIAGVLGLIETQNQQSVGNVLETIFQDIQANGPLGNELDDLFAFLFGTTDPDDILAAYDEISGREHAQVVQASLTTAQMFNTLVGDQMDRTLLTVDGTRFANLGEQRYASAAALAATDASAAGAGSHGLNRGASGLAVWARGFGQWGEVDGDVEAQGYDHDASGVAGGVEYAINSNASIGGAVVYSNNDVDFNTPGDEAEIDAWQLGAYGTYGFGNFYAGGTVSYGWQDVSTVRTIGLPVPGAPFVALAGYDADAWSLNGEIGGIWQAGKVNVQPSFGLAYTSTDIDGFTETGNAGAYSLNVTGSDADSFASILALRASGVWTMGKTRVIPDIKVGWRHEFEDDRQSVTSIFVGDATDTPFTIVSSEIQQDSALLSAGIVFGLTDNLEVFGDVNGLYNADASSTNASGGVRLTW